jgi:gliding motility-associated-like protein
LSTTGGTVPITASWSNGSSGLTASNLLAGSYTVTVTDNTGCTAVQNFNLTAPLPLDFSIKSRNPKCTDQHKGTLTIGAATGGVPPYMVSVNGAVAQGNTFPLTIDQLADGPYTVEVTDGNGCTSSQQANITSPPLPAVDLGPDLTQYPGDSTLLTGILHVTQLDTFYWSPTQFMSNPGDLTTYVKPEHTQAYTLTVQDTSGCKASDQVLVVVKKTPRVFVPNVFHPGSANARNEYFTVYGGPEVVRVHHMQVFDRWGDLVFENRDFPPNSPKDGWDGRYAGKDVNPGVFIYVIELELIKGDTDTVSGDITVVR